MGLIIKFCGKLQLGPAETDHSSEIPLTLGVIGTPLYDQDILSPADLHGLSHESLIALIGAEKLSHPAHIAGREASSIRIVFPQIF